MPDPIPNTNVQGAAAAGPAAAAQQAAAPVYSCLSIPQPAPFCSYPGDPPLLWHAWYHVFSTYLRLLEEERGMPLSDLTKNSLLFELLGTEGRKQFSGNPMADTLETATFAEFQQSVAVHFQHPMNTARAIWDLRHRRQGGTE